MIDGRHGPRRAGDGPGRGGPCAGAARPGARGDRDLPARAAGPRGPQTPRGCRPDRRHRGALEGRRGVDHPAVGVLRRVHGRAALRPGDPRPAPLVQPRGPGGADRAAARRVRHRARWRRPHGGRKAQRELLAEHPGRADERAVRVLAGHGGHRRRGLVGVARADRSARRGAAAHPHARALRRRAPRGAPGGRRPGAHHPHADQAARGGDLGPARLLGAGRGQFGARRRPAGHHGVRP